MSRRKQDRAEQLPRPKAGPGQVFRREPVDARGSARRFRNIAVTPLHQAWYKGQLCSPVGSLSLVTAEDRLAAGEILEGLWYRVGRSPYRDSTEAVIGHGQGLYFSENWEDAADRLNQLAAKMGRVDWLIVSQFCGAGVDLATALNCAGVDVHPDGRVWRLREALDALVCAVSGWREAKKALREKADSQIAREPA